MPNYTGNDMDGDVANARKAYNTAKNTAKKAKKAAGTAQKVGAKLAKRCGCSCCGGNCCGCGCCGPAALVLVIAILMSALSPTYLIEVATDYLEKSYVEDLTDRILGVYESEYQTALTNCKEAIADKKSSYSNANLPKGSDGYVTIAETLGITDISEMDNGGEYSTTHTITANGLTFTANYEYMIDTVLSQTKKSMQDVANVPYIIAAFSYYLESIDSTRESMSDYIFGWIGNHLSFVETEEDKLISALSGGTEEGKLFGYQIVESDTLDGADVTYRYYYAVTTYKYRYEDGTKIYVVTDENGELAAVPRGTKGALELSVAVNDEKALAFIEKYNETSSASAAKMKATETTERSNDKLTINGNYYTGIVYMNDLYSILSAEFGLSELSDEQLGAISVAAGTFEAYSESILGVTYMEGDINAIMTCSGTEIPAIFATEEKTNYGLVAWAKMANSYDSTTTNAYGQDTPSRWGYVWGYRGQKFTANGYASVYNVGDNHYIDNLDLYLQAAKWIGRRVCDCNGLCVGYVDYTVGDDGKASIGSTMPYGVNGTMSLMPVKGYNFSDFDETIVGQCLMTKMDDGSGYGHIGIYCGYNEKTECYEVIQASGEYVGVIKTSYTKIEDLYAHWDAWGYLGGVTYYEPDTDEAQAEILKYNTALASYIK